MPLRAGPRGQILFAPLLELGESARENVDALQFVLDLRVADNVEFSGMLFPPEALPPGPNRFTSRTTGSTSSSPCASSTRASSPSKSGSA
jgi:hypothetical protein